MSEDKPTTSKGNKNDGEGDGEGDGDNKSDGAIDSIRKLIADKLSIFSTDSDDSTAEKVIQDLSFDGLIKHWKEQGFKNVITMVGAGISTSAGIPDFRSPGSGLYNNLQKYSLPHPSAIFELNYFHDNPKPFFALAKELYPGTFNPTPSHYFVRLLHEKGLLLRHYTQNIDTLERIAGIPEEKLVEAHGTFYNNHCLGCQKHFSMEWMKEQIFADRIPSCDKCRSVVKPDIVFFGENLPHKFYTLPSRDFDSCDLLIIMGTSLEVQPFASLIDRAGPRCVRLLINRTMVGNEASVFTWFESEPSLLYDSPKNTRDVAYIGDCDDGCMALAEELGWGDELKKMIANENESLRKKNQEEKEQLATSNHKNSDSKDGKSQNVAEESAEQPTTSTSTQQQQKQKDKKSN